MADTTPPRDENMIAALKRERAVYVAAGNEDRVAQVDEQLRHYGYQGEQDPVAGRDGGPKGRTAPEDTKRTADTDNEASGDAGPTAAAKRSAPRPQRK